MNIRNIMSACACIGPPGDCPCIRASKGLPVPIVETFVAPEIFDCLTEEEKGIINKLKHEAFFRWMGKKKNGNSIKETTVDDGTFAKVSPSTCEFPSVNTNGPGIDGGRSLPNSFRY